MDYSDLSISITNDLDKLTKKSNGIFFTPPETVNKTYKLLKPHMKHIKTILEPSCGSCEYITPLDKQYSITGIEYNTTIFSSIKHLSGDNLTLVNTDYIKWNSPQKYDLIIGNPPFYVMSKTDVDNEYYKYFSGRPNIFILFVIKSLSLLNKNGILSFILPTSFLNSFYYEKTRNYIYENFKILHILEGSCDYLETSQNTVILIVQNTKKNVKNDNFIIRINGIIIFGTPKNIKNIRKLYKDSTTLKDLGFIVKVGNIVWNQKKSILTDDKTKTLLIYSSDIKNNKLNIQNYKNPCKKNYINLPGENTPLLIVNRGYGNSTYKFNYHLIKGGYNYCIENHLICIRYTKEIENDKLVELYEKIIKSFNDDKTTEFIKIFFGNNAMNTNELCNILPIYI